VVSAPPQLTATPSLLSFYYQEVNATNNVTMQTITLTAGSLAVNFAFTFPSWITPNPSTGTVAAGQSLTVSVTVTPPASCTPSSSPCSGTLSLTTSGPTQNIPVTLTVSNNPLLNLTTTPLTFSSQIGAAAPAAASVTPGSTGAALAYTVSTSGVSWLTVTPTSGTTPTPVSIAVNPVNLGPGIYNGTVTFTAGGATQSISVTLTVTNNAVLVPSATSLWFAYQIGQQAPAAQSLKITSSNGAPLNYSATATTTTTPTWLILTGQTSASTDNSFTVSANITGLSANTYTGQIAIAVTDPATGATATVNIAVTLYVGANALLLMNPSQPVVFTAQAYLGQSSPLQNYALASTSTDVLGLVWGQPTVSWLGVFGAPSSTPGTLGLQATPPASMTPGTYTGSVTVTATGPAGAVLDSPVTIPVVLQLASGTISVSSASLSFSESIGGTAPPAQTIAVSSNVPGLAYYPSAYDGGIGWLSVSATTGTTNGSFNVSVDASKLAPGNYQGKVVVLSPSAAGSPVPIPVTFTVTPGTISAPTSTLSFMQVQQSSAAPAAQSVAVSGSPGALNFTVTASTTGGGSWLTATPLTGTTPATVQVGINAAVAGNLQAGTYNGTVAITSTGASGSPINIPVTLTVVATQTFTAAPASLTFSYTIGLTAPAAQTFQLSSSGGIAPFSVTTPSSASWLQVSPTSGSTPATLSVSVNPQGLAANSYTATIGITSPYSSTAGAASVTVNFTVSQIIVTPTAITNAASYAAGAVSPGENIVIFGTSIGPPNLTYGALTPDGSALSTSAGNTQVLFDGVSAPVVYASDKQTSVMVPYQVAGRPTTSVIVQYQGVQSTPLVYNVQAAVPGIYTQNFQGTGPGAILNQDGVTGNGPGTPAARNSVVSVYMTGEGQTSPGGTTGAIAPVNVPVPWKQPLLKATATVANLPAVVQYYGSAPGLVSGVMQVNVQIPASTPSGAVPIVILLTDPETGFSYSTQGKVTVAVQ